MKKLLRALLCCAAFLLLSVSAAAEASPPFSEVAEGETDGAELFAEVTNGDWVYNVSNEGVTIAKYQGTDANVTIPVSVTLDGVPYRLRTIGENAFEGNVSLRSVTIPESITKLGFCAFKNCSSLSSVTIQGNLTDCASGSVDSYYSPRQSVFYGAGTNAQQLTVTFSDTVTRIPSYLFATHPEQSNNAYAHITDVIISDSVTEIGSYAFYHCYDLANLTLGASVNAIGAYAFAGNAAMQTLSLNQSLQTLGEGAFSSSTVLRNVRFNSAFADAGSYAFANCTALPSIEFPASIKNLGEKAFQNCTQLRSVTINGRAGSVVSLGFCAFQNCSSLSDLTVNANLADCASGSVDSYYSSRQSVFYGAGTNAETFTVTFSDAVTRIPAYLFATHPEQAGGVYARATDVVIGDSVTEIGSYAFYHCYDLANLTLGDAVAKIDAYAFAGNAAMRTLSMNQSLQTLGEGAFSNNAALRTVSFNSGFAEAGRYAFQKCAALPSVEFPASVKVIGEGAFLDCTQLRSVTINGRSGGAVSLGFCAFKNCSSLSSLTVNANLSDCASGSTDSYYSPRQSAFYGAGINAETFTVTFSDAVTRIPAYLFATYPGQGDNVYANVTDVYISDKVTEIGKFAFYHCFSLLRVSYAGSESAWSAVSVGENNAPLTDATFQYNVRLNMERFRLGPIAVSDLNGAALTSIPAGKCFVTIPISNVAAARKPDGQILLAAFSASGQFEELLLVGVEDFPLGGVMRATVSLDNSAGRITQLKAFMVNSLSNLTPQSGAVSFPA